MISNDVAIRATLDIGDAIANAGRLADSLDGVGKAMPSSIVGGDLIGLDSFIQKLKSVKGIIDSIAEVNMGDSLFPDMDAPVQQPAPLSMNDDRFAWKMAIEQTRAEFAAKLSSGQSINEDEMQRAINARVESLYSSITKAFRNEEQNPSPSLFDDEKSQQHENTSTIQPESWFTQDDMGRELDYRQQEAVETQESVVRKYNEEQSRLPEPREDTTGEPELWEVPVSVVRKYQMEQGELPKITDGLDIPPESMDVSVSVRAKFQMEQGELPKITDGLDIPPESMDVPVSVRAKFQMEQGQLPNIADGIKIPPESVDALVSVRPKFQMETPAPTERPVSADHQGQTQKNREAESREPDREEIPASVMQRQETEQTTSRPTREDIMHPEEAPTSPDGLSVATEQDLKKIFENMGTILQKAVSGGDAVSARDAARLMLRAENQSRLSRKGFQPAKEKSRESKEKTQYPGSVIGRLLSETKRYGTAIGTGRIGEVAVGAATHGPQLMSFLKTLSPAARIGGGVAAAGLVAGFAGNKLSEAYEQVMQPAMKLAATLGTLTGEYSSNSKAFHSALGMASQSAVNFGYSMQDGLGVMTELARYGLNPGQSMGLTSKVFAFERGTGADRGILDQAAGIGARYNAGDALSAAYGGTLSSGMNTGQFQEYLSATLRIFEEGLSRGVVKGFGEVTRVQNFIASIGGRGNPLWQGEQGYQRYKTMSDATVAAAGLDREYDVIAYQAMDEVLKKAASNGFKDDKEGNKWSEYKKYSGGSYIDTMRALEGGLTPEYFKTVMDSVSTKISGGNKEGTIEAIKHLWNVNNSAAATIYEAYKTGRYTQAAAVIKDPTSSASPELKLLQVQEDIKVKLVEIGESVLPIKATIMGAVDGIFKFLAGDKMAKESAVSMIPMASRFVPGSNLLGSNDSTDAVDNFMFAGKAALEGRSSGKQPDADRNGIGDYADAYWNIEKYMQAIPEEQRQFIAITGKFRDLLKGIKGPEDLPGVYKTMQSPSFMKGFDTFDKLDDPNNFSTSRFKESMDASLVTSGNQITGKGALTFPSYLYAGIEGKKSGALDIMQLFTAASGGDLEKLFKNVPNITKMFEDSVRVAREKQSEGEGKDVITDSEWKTIYNGLLTVLSEAANKIAGAADKMAENTSIQVIVPTGRPK